MSETLLVAPSVPFAPATPRDGVAARVLKALAAPARWLRQREISAELAQLSEREWSDIGAGVRDFGYGYPVLDDGEDRAARRVALRAWSAPRKLAA
jgi:uncharacterized protein YjiS (DUF1127 family)